MATELLDVNILGSRQKIAALDFSQLLYLLVDVRTPSQMKLEHVPLSLCLVIDRSTSMKGERLDKVKSAASLLIEKLSPGDIISVVTFSDRAEVVLPAIRADNKQTLIARVRSIIASGGTEIYQGLVTGVKEMSTLPLQNYTNHLILLTDGQTYGDDSNCITLARKIAAQNIGISAFGIGSDWNDQFLDRLVAPSGGQSAYIESATKVLSMLQDKIQGLGTIYAQNLRLLPELPKGIHIKSGFKVAPFAQPLGNEGKDFKLGAIEGRSPLLILLEFVIDPQLPGRKINLTLNVSGDIPTQQAKNYLSKKAFEISVVTEDPRIIPPKALIEAVQALNFYRLNEKVWQEVEDGDLPKATARMRRLTTRLLEAGHANLAQQAYSETERLSNLGTLSLEGRKRLKYGTRSLLTQTMKLVRND